MLHCSRLFALLALLILTNPAQAQNVYTWSSPGTSAWLTASSWNGGVPGANDIAHFGPFPISVATGVGINMNGATNNGPNNQAVGAIDIHGRLSNFLIGNSSGVAAGTLTLNGATVDGIDDTILANRSPGTTFTIQNTQGGGTQTMTLALGSNFGPSTPAVIQAVSGSSMLINVNITELTAGTGINVRGGGLVVFGGSNSFTGPVTLTSGIAQFNSLAAFGGGAYTIDVGSSDVLGFGYVVSAADIAARVAANPAGTIAFGNGVTIADDLDFSTGALSSSTVSLGSTSTATYSATLTPHGTTYRLGGGGGTLTISSNLTDDGATPRSVEMVRAGTVILTGTNSYTGDTLASGGTLQFNSTGAIGGSGANVKATTGGAVGFNFAGVQAVLNSRVDPTTTGAIAIGTASAAEAINFNTAGLEFASFGAAGTVTYSGTLTPFSDTYRLGGSGNLTVSSALAGAGYKLEVVGPGRVILTSTNVNINGGTTIHAGATLQLGVNGTTGFVQGNIVNNGTLQLNRSGSPTFGTVSNPFNISGSGNLELAQTGTAQNTLTLAGNNSYTGSTSILTGLISAGSTTAFGNNSAMSILSTSATLDLKGFVVSLGSLAGAGTVTSSVAGGQLTVGGDNTTTNYNGRIAASLSLIKTGTGSFVLSNPNVAAGTYSNFSGGTTVNQGGLYVLGGNASFSGAGIGNVVVNGGTFGGTGFVVPTLGNTLTVNSTGSIRGGTPAEVLGVGALPTGTLTVGSSVFVNGGILAVDLGGTDDENSILSVIGASNSLNFNVGTEMAPTPFFITLLNDQSLVVDQPYTMTIATSAGGFFRNGDPATTFTHGTDFQLDSSNYSFTNITLEVSGSNLVLGFTPSVVPEPSQLLLVGAFLMAALRTRRSRLAASIGPPQQ